MFTANPRPMALFRQARLALALLLLVSLAPACAKSKTPTPKPGGDGATGLTYARPAAAVGATTGGESGMRLALSAASEEPVVQASVALAASEPLTTDQTQAVLNRLPAMPTDPEQAQPFRLPPQTLPAPRPGQTLQQPFPPPQVVQPGTQPASGPLHVLRYSPEGDVDLAPFLSVTFDQPMVALTAIEDLAAKDVPVKLTPQPEGAWRWVGTKTLVFEPTLRFPMATKYQVEVPVGTTSAVGGKLAEKVSFGFTTPPPRLQSSYPNSGPQVRSPLLFASFDQRIDPQAVLKTVSLRAGNQSFALVLATAEEVAKDETVSDMVKNTVEGRWLAFRPSELLPYDTTVNVDIGPGTPSAEGPLTTQSAQSFSFQTYGPLRIVENQCGWGDQCRPLMPWYVRFSNPLDEQAFDETMVQISPELPGGKLSISGETLVIEGRSAGRTTYRVTLKTAIQDRFGQTLGTDQTVMFDVGSVEPYLATYGETLVVLDPAGKPTYSIFSINYDSVNLTAYAVEPSQWSAFQQYLQDASNSRTPGNPPGRQVLSQKVPIEKTPDTLVETPIDLGKLLTNGRGHLILVIEAEPPAAQGQIRQEPRVIRVWVQATGIALDAFVDGGQITAWANSLSDGAPLADVEIALVPSGAKAKTGNDGLARLPLPTTVGEKPSYLTARTQNDSALLPEQSYWWGSNWHRVEPVDECRWYVFDDRAMYRPGEQVHFKGWVRTVGLQEGADVFRLPAAGSSLSYKVLDSRDNELLNGRLEINAWGGFDGSFSLPENMNLGQAVLRFNLSGANAAATEFAHTFQVQEFRRPEFEVSTRVSEGPHFAGGRATATVEAKYYAGGPLPNAAVNWQVTSQPTTYHPPNWDDFDFGIWTPWWKFYDWEPSRGEARVQSFQGTTDAAGIHTLRIDFSVVDPPRPTSVIAEASVMDVNRQAWAASSTVLVHPADLYVGLRTSRTFYEKGKPILFDAIVTDLDGKPVADRSIELRTVRLEWQWNKGTWSEVEVGEQRLTLGSQDKPVSGSFDTPEGGTYRITATISDAQGRKNLTQLTRWVSGGKQPSAEQVQQEEATLIPDRKEYQPGDTAEILVQSPFAPAEGLLTLRRGGILYTERFRMTEQTYTVRVPITEAYIPNLWVQVDLVGAAIRLNSQGEADTSLPSRPAYAKGSLELSVPPYSRTLSVQAVPQARELEPGGETVVDVQVKDAAGQPVAGAELAVAVVDEAILALTNYQLADPLAAFYQRRDDGVGDYHSRQYILLANPEHLMAERTVMAMAAPAPAATMVAESAKAYDDGRGGGEEANAPIRVRSDFNPLAVFEPSVPTDAQGRAAVRVKVPDNLTRYRVMVVAVEGQKQFGKGESSITARLPLMARPSPPRFLNFGDSFELPVVVQNQTDAPMSVDVAVRATNVRLTGPAGQRLTVPARDRREVRFAFSTESAGTAHFQVGAVSGSWADAAEFSLPVYTPATTEAFAVYGTLDEGSIAQPVEAPSAAFPQFGGLEISTSSTALQALSDAVLYLVSYPFECAEQLASRILAVAALRDVLSAFQATGLPKPQETLSAVQRDIEKLQGLQNTDGGFPIWKQGSESWPFHTIHAVHALARAKEKGFDVPQDMLSKGLDYLRRIEDKYPSWYSQDVRNTLTAYALYVRARLSDVDTVRARRLVQEQGLDKLQPEAIGWLLYVLSGDSKSATELDQIRRHLANRVVETAGAANFTTSYREEDGYLLLASNRRADGVLLEALIRDQPQSDLIPKLVAGLLSQRKRGRWDNTQENVFILLALDQYFNTYEKQTPEFVARVWLGEQYVAGFQFVGRSTDYQAVQVPMSFLAQRSGTQDLILSKDGVGRLYYRLGIQYAPSDLQLEPLDQGFTVLRVYEAVDDPEDVTRDAQGTWHVRAGARVRVRLTLVAPTRRYHVALTDPLPAGFETMNLTLAVTGSVPADPANPENRNWWWHWTWYEHQNLRDQRAEAFSSLLWDGVYTYTYVARATTPGRFVAPPAKAEEMYAPETFGRSGTDHVVVE